MNKSILKYFFIVAIVVIVIGFFWTFDGYKHNPAKNTDGLSSEQLKAVEDASKDPENLKIFGNNINTTKTTMTEKTFDPTKLNILDEKIGTGQEVKGGDTVQVHYTGTLLSGKKFDSSKDRNQPFSFVVGGGQVIQGWEKGLLGMKVGGKRKLTIPPSLGYGTRGVPGTIPANAVLIFEIELLKVFKGQQ